MLPEWFVLVAVALNLVCATGGYVVAVLKGNAQPNRVTWFLWGLAPLIAFAAEIQQGVGIRSLFTLAAGLGPLLVVGASFISRHAEWRLTRFDLVCGALSIVGLVLWQLSGDGNLAIVFAIAADALAGTPTVIKAYRSPDTEHPPAFAFGCAASVITLLTISDWSFASAAFPLYVFLITGLILALLLTRVGVRRTAAPTAH